MEYIDVAKNFFIEYYYIFVPIVIAILSIILIYTYKKITQKEIEETNNNEYKIDSIVTKQSLINEMMGKLNPKMKIVVNEKNNKIQEDNLLKIAGSLVKNSENLFLKQIQDKVVENNIEIYSMNEYEIFSDKGIKGTINDVTYYIGNEEFMNDNLVNLNDMKEKSNELLNNGKKVLYLSKGKNFIGAITYTNR